jgi:iduronate 2-sulfatase
VHDTHGSASVVSNLSFDYDYVACACLGFSHGWQLGEHNEWCKTTLFELALHIPFMIRDPRASAPYGHSGAVTAAFAENIDIYRTLAELSGLEAKVESSVDGVSLAPLLVNPDHTQNPKAKHAAFSQQAHCLIDPHTNLPIDVWTVADSCTMTPRESLGFMGYSIRTNEWRLTAWLQWDGDALQADWSAINGTELYNHTGDDGLTLSALDDYENDNVAHLNPGVVSSLMAQLRGHFQPLEPHD